MSSTRPFNRGHAAILSHARRSRRTFRVEPTRRSFAVFNDARLDASSVRIRRGFFCRPASRTTHRRERYSSRDWIIAELALNRGWNTSSLCGVHPFDNRAATPLLAAEEASSAFYLGTVGCCSSRNGFASARRRRIDCTRSRPHRWRREPVACRGRPSVRVSVMRCPITLTAIFLNFFTSTSSSSPSVARS